MAGQPSAKSDNSNNVPGSVNASEICVQVIPMVIRNSTSYLHCWAFIVELEACTITFLLF